MSEHNRYKEEELEEELKNSEPKKHKNKKKSDHHHDQVDSSKEQIATLQKELDELTDQLLRNRAELENFKRRMNDERIQDRKYALQGILTDLIEIVDLFDTVVNTKTDDEKVKSFLIGFQMLNNKFKELLENYGVKKIDALNQPFDHNYHEAVSSEFNEELDEETVIKVISNGYIYKDRVIRPSKVIVSTKVQK